MPEVTRPALRAIGEAGRWIQAAMALAVIAVGAHLIAVVTRGWPSTGRPGATCTSSSRR